MNVSGLGGWQGEHLAQQHYGNAMLREEHEDTVFRHPIGQGNFGNSNYEHKRGGFNGHRGTFGRSQFGNRKNEVFERNEEGGDIHRATGHQAFLKGLMRSAAVVRIVTTLGDEYIGVIKGCDETTISLRINCADKTNPELYQNRVFFKQNLIEFAPVVEGVTFS